MPALNPHDEIEEDIRKAFGSDDDKPGATSADDTAVADKGTSESADATKGQATGKSEPTADVSNKDAGGTSDKKAAKKADDITTEPPARWTAEEKKEWAETFGALDPNDPKRAQWQQLQKILLSRNKGSEDFLSKQLGEIQTERQKYQGYSALDQVLAPRRASIEASGETVHKTVADLFALSDFAAKTPEDFVRWFVNARKLDQAKLFPQTAPQQQHGQADPDDPLGIIPQSMKQHVSAIPAVQQRIQQLEQQIAQANQRWQSMDQQSAQRTAHSAHGEVAQFVQATDANGQPAYPFYSDLREHMATLLESGSAADLKSAYDMAVWANPRTRQHLLDSEKARQSAEAARSAAAKAAQARGASGSILPSGSSAPASSAPVNDRMSLEEMIAAQWDHAASGGRV